MQDQGSDAAACTCELGWPKPLLLSGNHELFSPFQVKTAYQLLDDFHHGSVEGQPSVTALMEEAELLRKQQDLFELYISDYIFLQRCMVRGVVMAAVMGLWSRQLLCSSNSS